MKNYIVTLEVVNLWRGRDEQLLETRVIHLYNIETEEELNTHLYGTMDGLVEDYVTENSDVNRCNALPLKMSNSFTEFAMVYLNGNFSTKFFIKVEEA